jgi:hypothetical protein
MFNTITKLYNMLGEIIGIHTIKKKKCNNIYDGYTADDEKSDDFDNISEEFDDISEEFDNISEEGGGDGGGGGYDDNTIMVDGLELILLKILKL